MQCRGYLVERYPLVTRSLPPARLSLQWDSAEHGFFVPSPAVVAIRLMHGGMSCDLGTADWVPDLAGSAAQASSFVLQATGRPVDGVIALDPAGFQCLIALVGGASGATSDAGGALAQPRSAFHAGAFTLAPKQHHPP